jgi:hypothetical protein
VVTPIHNARIDLPVAWRGGDFSKDDISFDLSAEARCSAGKPSCSRFAALVLRQGGSEQRNAATLHSTVTSSGYSTKSKEAEASLSCAACLSTHTQSKMSPRCLGDLHAFGSCVFQTFLHPE